MPLSIEDQLDIMELMARYNHAIDGSQPEAWADTFTDDGVFEGSVGKSSADARRCSRSCAGATRATASATGTTTS